MSKYVTVEFLRKHSRIDCGVCTDEELEQLLETAEEVLADDLQVKDLKAFEDSDGHLPAKLVSAILMLAGSGYENREAEAPVQMHIDPRYIHLIARSVEYKR